ncbi:MAG TPA: glucose-6-phosphate dehydrogenase, partial [Anaerolineae bacterium]
MLETQTLVNPLREGLPVARSPQPATMVIFGVTGDLTHRKLMPALYNLARERYTPPNLSIVGVARRPKTDQEIRDEFRDAMNKYSRTGGVQPAVWESFAQSFSYVQTQFDDLAGYGRLKDKLDTIDRERGTQGNRLFYLATPPELYSTIVANLGASGLCTSPGWTRIIVEKPFGHDLASAQELDESLHKVYHENQIYRIDHYLGKETVQNVYVLRFANGIFEPIWNRRYIDHVQITVAESIGIEGRGEYYDNAGALRDI